VHPAILYVANLLGIAQVYKIGGAQAIAAMAYGTASVPRVDKIFGPGSPYTTVAKQLLASREVEIDLVAGASEALVIADESATPQFVAADLLAQAEHGTTSHVVLISTSERIIRESLSALEVQLAKLPRREEAEASLKNSVAIEVPTLERAMEISNWYAPEHLLLQCEGAEELSLKVRHAGSVFIGHIAAEILGDYESGTNHILPTGGWARRQGGVALRSFYKGVTFQRVSEDGLQLVAGPLALLARTEELEAHARALDIRLRPDENR